MKINKSFKYIQLLCVLLFFDFIICAKAKQLKKSSFSLLTPHRMVRMLFLQLVVFMQLGIFQVVSLSLLLFLPPIKLKHGMRIIHVFSFQLCFIPNSKINLGPSASFRYKKKAKFIKLLWGRGCSKITFYASLLVLNLFQHSFFVFYLL